MIFITVGNGKFDPLIQEMDRLIETGKIKEKVIAQIGTGSYTPKHITSFKFESPLDKYYEKADLVISHGGPGIVFEVLRRKKKLVALPNRDRTDPRHQVEYLQAMAQETSALLYCDAVEKLEETLQKAKTHQFSKYHPPKCTMHKVVRDFVQ
ncbi:glycosyltransferase [Candidatus Woesearchaeota archaeon]|nr:glycosyltransferase [Candidatus Woesearchaeota archaeon]